MCLLLLPSLSHHSSMASNICFYVSLVRSPKKKKSPLQGKAPGSVAAAKKEAKKLFDPNAFSAKALEGVAGLQPAAFSSPDSKRKARLDSIFRAAIISKGEHHAVVLFIQAEDLSNQSQYLEYIVKQNMHRFSCLIDIGKDLKLHQDGLAVKNNKGYDRRVFLGIFTSPPTKKQTKQLLTSWAEVANEITGSNPKAYVPQNFIMPYTSYSQIVSLATVKDLAEAFFGEVTDSFWDKHGPSMEAFWPFGTWTRGMMAHYHATEEVLDPSELLEEGSDDEEEEEEEDEAAEEDIDLRLRWIWIRRLWKKRRRRRTRVP